MTDSGGSINCCRLSLNSCIRKRLTRFERKPKAEHALTDLILIFSGSSDIKHDRSK